MWDAAEQDRSRGWKRFPGNATLLFAPCSCSSIQINTYRVYLFRMENFPFVSCIDTTIGCD